MEDKSLMKVSWQELAIPGLCLSSGATLSDERGTFTKVLSGPDDTIGTFIGREAYWTRSARGVLRGFHFQLPPDETTKLVYVTHGKIRDFVIDLRVGSPSENRVVEVELNPATGGLLVPPGCGHAYEVLEDDSIVCYIQDVPHTSDATYGGIRIDSTGVVPRTSDPIILPRDLDFPRLDEFHSPFSWKPV